MKEYVSENLFNLEQGKMPCYFVGKYQLDLTNGSYCEFANLPFLSE